MSAKLRYSENLSSKISMIKIRKDSGLKLDPWASPELAVSRCDLYSLNTT